MAMEDVNLQQIHDLLVDVAHEAGRMILAATPTHQTSGTKKNSADLVTETDRAVEHHVSNRLLKAFPNFSFIGEETYTPGITRLTSSPTFIVDPIDGTTNFIHGFPNACISLGFVENKIPSVGVIYNPFLSELYTGIRGHGAYLSKNGGIKQRLPLKPDPEPLKDLGTCLIATEWGSEQSGPNLQLKSRVFTKLIAAKADGGAAVHSLRCMGSVALDLAALAAGWVDVFWDGGCWAWDVAAGWCILVEAGGVMVGGNPGEWEAEIDGRAYLAIRGSPEKEGERAIVKEFWNVLGDGRLKYES